jgi:hypothetical protein
MSTNHVKPTRRIAGALMAVLTLALALLLAPGLARAQDSPTDAPDAGEGQANDGTREFGVWWVEDYAPAGAGGSDLPATRPDALGLRNYLTSTCKLRILGVCWVNWPSPPWTSRFVYGNTNAWSTDWRRSANGGSENFYIDTIDLAYFAGHGSANGILFGVGSPAPATVTKNDGLTSWGTADADWLGLAACNVLDDPYSNLQGWANAMNGVRLLLGFKTVMNDVPHGEEFGRYIRDGYSLTQAWFKAADKLQSQNRVARVLAEEQAHFNDTAAHHGIGTPVDSDFYWWTHTVGSEPARNVDVAAIDGAMPVLRVQPLGLDEAVSQVNNLGAAFGVDVSAPTTPTQNVSLRQIVAETDVFYSQDGQLEMDNDYGLFLHADMANLWTTDSALSRQADAGVAMQSIDEEVARRVADAFLQQNGLARADAQFYEVAEDVLSFAPDARGANSDRSGAAVLDETMNYQVIYSRIISYTPTINGRAADAPVEFSVMGPGSKFKIYVSTQAPTRASFAEFVDEAVIGGMGGYRAIQTPAEAAAARQLQMVQMLSMEVIAKLFANLEEIVALDQIPLSPDEVVSREIVSSTPAYWEGAIGFNQSELIPVYALEVRNTMRNPDESTYVVSSTTYIPVEAGYMAPLARISTTASLDTPLSPGAVIPLEALDASKTLVELGLDPSPDDGAPLNFVLGSGEVTYDWYLNEVSENSKVGTGRFLNYTVDLVKGVDVKEGAIGTQRIILVVTDTAKDSEPFTSQAVVTFQAVPPVFLPTVLR